MSRLHAGEPLEWATSQFSGIDLGDARLEKRTIHVAAAMAGRPGVSIPRLFVKWGETKAAYNLFAHPSATPRPSNTPIVSKSARLSAHPGSSCCWKTPRTARGRATSRCPVGPIGTGAEGLQGFQLHTTLAVAWSHEPWQ
ncbi:MAG: hypothetical protein HC897_13620, partial [Thermoanaerobaculia bacterium]|nr:hypothetical protein [Thermoanaerobaculia bacterium]